MHMLSGSDRETSQVAEAGVDPVAMVDYDRSPVTTEIVREPNHAIRRGKYRLPDRSGNVHACVEGTLAIEGINTFAKRSVHLDLNRPEVGGGMSSQQFSGRGVAGNS